MSVTTCFEKYFAKRAWKVGTFSIQSHACI